MSNGWNVDATRWSCSERARGEVDRLTAPRPDFAGLSMDRPRLMGILNVPRPTAFPTAACSWPDAPLQAGPRHGRGGRDLDIGGESTRPGAAEVETAEEIARTVAGDRGPACWQAVLPLSIDTRKAPVALTRRWRRGRPSSTTSRR
jgi:dihydropteroate synthase